MCYGFMAIIHFYLFQRGTDFRRQNLRSKDGPRTERLNRSSIHSMVSGWFTNVFVELNHLKTCELYTLACVTKLFYKDMRFF